MAYEVVVLPAADKVIAKLPKSVRTRVDAQLISLETNARPARSIKLTGADMYRIRVGDYRIIYAIRDAKLIVVVVDVGHRSDVYRRK